MASQAYYGEMKSGNITVRYGFRAPDKSYDGAFGTETGIKKVTSSVAGVGYGTNSPKLDKIRVTFKVGTGANARLRSTTRFCAPDKTTAATSGNKLVGKKIRVNGKEYPIERATRA